MQTIETYLPVFTGFYNTIFEGQTESEMEYINEQRAEKGLQEITDCDIEWNYKEYEYDVCKQCTDFIFGFFNSMQMIESMEMQNIVSPKEYNFRNDSINISVQLAPENCLKIKEYINNHLKEFRAYLKDNYTSCSGFYSSYSDDADVWNEDTDGFSDFSANGHYLGSILQFICNCENVDDETMFYSLEANLTAVDIEFECSKIKCDVCGEFYTPEKSLFEEYEELKRVQLENLRFNFEGCFECSKMSFIPFDAWIKRNGSNFKHC